MNSLKISTFLLFCVVACCLAWGGGNDQGYSGRGSGGGRSQGNNGGGRGSQGGRGNRGGRELVGGFQGFDGQRGGRQSFDGQDEKRYRSNLYSDDDVYGYDATYPNGESAYINYRSKDARARRGPEFARTSRAYSRQGGSGSNFGQQNDYRRGGEDIW